MGTAERREREREVRRAAILDAARQVFLARGPANATMDDVAVAAELSKGALYLYFASKEELFLALALRPLEALLESLEQAASRGSGLERVERLLRAHATSISDGRDSFRLAFVMQHERERERAGAPAEGSPAACAFREGKRKIFGHYLEAVHAGQRDRSIRSDHEASVLATQCWTAMAGLTVMTVHDARGDRIPEAAPVEVVAKATIALLVGALRAAAAPPARARRHGARERVR